MSGRKQQQVPFHVRKTTLLPSSLRDELVAAGKLDAPKPRGGGSTSVLGRKQRRKDERQMKKPGSQKQPASTAARPSAKAKGKQRAVEAEPKDTGMSDTAGHPSNGSSKKRKRQAEKDDQTADEKAGPSVQKRKIAANKQTPLQRLLDKTNSGSSSKKGKTAAPTGMRTDAEEQEDAEIAWLEAKLGIRKDGKGRKEMQEDGLDDLLDDLDRLDEEIFGAEDDDDEQDSAEDDESEVDDEEEYSDVASGSQDEEIADQIASEAEMSDFYTDEGEEGDEGVSGRQDAPVPDSVPSTATGTKYIPPALRKAQASKEAAEPIQDPRLRRQLLGLLNRLSPTNFPTLVLNPADSNSLHSIYLSNARAVITKLLITLIIGIIAAQGDGIGDTQVVVLSALVKVLSTGLVGGMAGSGGKEFAASLVDSVVTKLDEKDGQEDKQRLNLVGFLSMLYNFQVVACNLVYDLIKEFISSGLKEDDVEALLRIVKTSGQQLRHDDPTALKQIIQLVQDQHKSVDAATLSSRTRFMVETLTNLRNNKVKPGTGVAADAEQSLKKYIANISKSASVSTEPLRISLADLRAAGTKGKWWLVGAAWSGNPLVDRQQNNEIENQDQEEKSKEARLLKLARKQGMNTDVRRQVFVALMSGEDYVDATDRLSALKLTEAQQREIIRVLLHCLGSEKAYNPYYTLVVARLLTNSPTSTTHSYQVTLQFALWDHFRSLGESDVGGAQMVQNASAGDEDVPQSKIRNMAKAFAWWVAKAGLGLNIFKPLPFPTLQGPSRMFMKHFLVSLVLSSQTSSPLLANISKVRDGTSIEKPFLQLVASNPDCARGLAWFTHNDSGIRKEIAKDDLVRWGVRKALDAMSVAERFSL